MYKLGMVRNLMESLDINTAKLAAFLEFNVNTMMVITKYSDVDDQLDDLEANFGIHQWVADAKELNGMRMTISGHREALAQTLQDCANDVDNAN
jgi:hypothetical protein